MQLTCPDCGSNCRIPSAAASVGAYSCPSCASELVDTTHRSHSNQLFKALEELQSIEQLVRDIKRPYLQQRQISTLEKRAQNANSRFRNWEAHLSNLKSQEAADLRSAYKLPMFEVGETSIRIKELVEDRRVYEKYKPVFVALEKILSPIIEIVNIVLGQFGLPKIASFALLLQFLA
jgi:hypothetical protein